MEVKSNRINIELVINICSFLCIDDIIKIHLLNKYYKSQIGKNSVLCKQLFIHYYKKSLNNIRSILIDYKVKQYLLKVCSVFVHNNILNMYLRLIPYHYEFNEFPSINVFQKSNLFITRALTKYELFFYKKSPITSWLNNNNKNKQSMYNKPSIHSFAQFKKNMNKLYYYSHWQVFLKKYKLFVGGGSILKCLSRLYSDQYSKNIYDECIEIYSYQIDLYNLEDIINEFISLMSTNFYCKLLKHKDEITSIYIKQKHLQTNISNDYCDEMNKTIIYKEKNWLQFNFIHFDYYTTIEQIIYSFDLDCCQLAFDGYNIYSSYSNIQSLNTGSFISYACGPKMAKYNLKRLFKYIDKNFILLVPSNFNFNYCKYGFYNGFDKKLRTITCLSKCIDQYEYNRCNSNRFFTNVNYDNYNIWDSFGSYLINEITKT